MTLAWPTTWSVSRLDLVVKCCLGSETVTTRGDACLIPYLLQKGGNNYRGTHVNMYTCLCVWMSQTFAWIRLIIQCVLLYDTFVLTHICTIHVYIYVHVYLFNIPSLPLGLA